MAFDRKEYMRVYRLENRERIASTGRAYNIKRESVTKAYNKIYYAEHRTMFQLRWAKYQETHAAELKEYRHLNRATSILKGREYRALHRDKLNAASRTYNHNHSERQNKYNQTGEPGRRHKIRVEDRKWFVRQLGAAYMSQYEVHHSWLPEDNGACRLLTRKEHLALELEGPCELIGDNWVEVYC